VSTLAPRATKATATAAGLSLITLTLAVLESAVGIRSHFAYRKRTGKQQALSVQQQQLQKQQQQQ
jgi:cell division protein FtsB